MNQFINYECAIVENKEDRHFLQNPIKLECDHYVCKGCIVKNEQLICVFCGVPTTRDLSLSRESNLKIDEIKSNARVLLNETKVRFEKNFDEYRGKFF